MLFFTLALRKSSAFMEGMTETSLRIHKFLARSGVCSRRAAEDLVRRGEVTINGEVAQIGDIINPHEDTIRVNNRLVKASREEPVTLILNKPKGFLCTNSDPHGGDTVFDLVPPPFNQLRLFCAGRLDKYSEGMVVLTNDGDLANQILHPSSGIIKKYQVTVTKPFPASKRSLLLKGFEHEGEFLQAEKIVLLPPVTDDASVNLEVHLHHGRKREIRRLFEQTGFLVKRLRRFQIGNLTLKGLDKGRSRLLSKAQIRDLTSPAKVEVTK